MVGPQVHGRLSLLPPVVVKHLPFHGHCTFPSSATEYTLSSLKVHGVKKDVTSVVPELSKVLLRYSRPTRDTTYTEDGRSGCLGE